jgi:hypothetical protein
MNNLELADYYDKAADYIEVHGWITGTLRRTSTGAVCAIGALGCAIEPRMVEGNWSTTNAYRGGLPWANWQVAARRILEFMPNPGTDLISLSLWNDEVATDKFEVIDLFRNAAKALRNAAS